MIGWILTAVLLLSGLLFIVRRRDVTWVQKAAIGARLPDGCAVAEGIVLVLLALVAGWLHWIGWW